MVGWNVLLSVVQVVRRCSGGAAAGDVSVSLEGVSLERKGRGSRVEGRESWVVCSRRDAGAGAGAGQKVARVQSWHSTFINTSLGLSIDSALLHVLYS